MLLRLSLTTVGDVFIIGSAVDRAHLAKDRIISQITLANWTLWSVGYSSKSLRSFRLHNLLTI